MRALHLTILCIVVLLSGCSAHRTSAALIDDIRAHPSLALELSEILERTHKEAQAQAAQLERVQEATAVRATLPPAVDVLTEGGPTRGPANAALTVVAFIDYECPYSAATYFDLLGLQAKYKDSVRLVFKHLPLSSHRQARIAAVASEIARDQGKFWEYSSKILHEQDFLSYPFLKEIGRKVGLDIRSFERALEHHRLEYLARVERDLADARRLNVSVAPTVFFNGIKFEGHKGAERYESLFKLVTEFN